MLPDCISLRPWVWVRHYIKATPAIYLNFFFFSIFQWVRPPDVFMLLLSMLHTAQLKVNQLIGTNCLLCLSLFAQLDAWWSMVVKMVRMRLTGPLSWGWCKWSSVTGMGVLYLLMLSTCLGQDTEGKASFSLHVLITVLPLHFVSLFCLMCLIQYFSLL